MGTAPAFASVSEAMDMAQAALGYLAAADPTRLAAETQAECLRGLERPMRSARRRGRLSCPRSPSARAIPPTRTIVPGPG